MRKRAKKEKTPKTKEEDNKEVALSFCEERIELWFMCLRVPALTTPGGSHAFCHIDT